MWPAGWKGLGDPEFLAADGSGEATHNAGTGPVTTVRPGRDTVRWRWTCARDLSPKASASSDDIVEDDIGPLTADIEQSLVIGAQGPRTLLVVMTAPE